MERPTHVKPVLTFGEPLVVCVPHSRGSLSLVREFETDAAGAELNTAIGVARLGVPVSYAASVGADPFGEFIRRTLLAEGVNVDHLKQGKKGATGLFFKQWSGLMGDSQVFYYRSASPMAIGDWDTNQLFQGLRQSEFGWVHSTGITWMIGEKTREQAITLLHTAYDSQIPISFDVNLRLKLADLSAWKQTIGDLVPYVTWLLLGDTEAEALYGTSDARVVEEYVRGQGFRGAGVVLKEGARGATASQNGQVAHVDALQVHQIIDTVGAGDGFNAGWIAGMVNGWEIERALYLGAVVGAYAIASAGDSSGYPMLEEAMNHLDGRETIAR
ncbi:sugar kinase [Alicyclobacillus dauci]|uniref:Sugar kinase n=1 Tax=Alicyclobacillus dauci TaxID=1475485 RepID=A0ABY6Z000_9BACL|nr:sugar kinase [Alicyclobacillus dauci]WAH36037.1 sugar kinase [Alicyclobacillus dauci]